jgi:hypothetical protein
MFTLEALVALAWATIVLRFSVASGLKSHNYGSHAAAPLVATPCWHGDVGFGRREHGLTVVASEQVKALECLLGGVFGVGFHGVGCGEDEEARAVLFGECQESVAHGVMEGDLFAVESVHSPGRVPSGKAFVRINIEQNGEMGCEVSCRPCADVGDALCAECSRYSLIGEGGVDISVAEDDVASSESGADDFGHVLCAVGGEQEGFHLRGEGRFSIVQDEASQDRTNTGAARFSCGSDGGVRLQASRHLFEKSALAGPFASLQRDKHAGAGRRAVHDGVIGNDRVRLVALSCQDKGPRGGC